MSDVGRNDPCPCGSGRKFKKCCMTATGQRASEPTEDEAAMMFSWLLEHHDLEDYAELRTRNLNELLGEDPRVHELSDVRLEGLRSIVGREFGAEMIAALDRVAPSGMTIAEEILDEERERMPTTARVWMQSLVASYQSLYEVTARLSGIEVRLRDVLHGDVVLADIDSVELDRVGAGRVYEYDFGDGWIHDVVVKPIDEVEPGMTLPRVVAGAGACPPEDVGGLGGYEALLEALADPNHESHQDYVEWIGSFDPNAFDLAKVNAKLARLGAKRRPQKPNRATDDS